MLLRKSIFLLPNAIFLFSKAIPQSLAGIANGPVSRGGGFQGIARAGGSGVGKTDEKPKKFHFYSIHINFDKIKLI